MELFRKLDEFTQGCTQIQARSELLNTVYLDSLDDARRSCGELQGHCKSLQPQHKHLEKVISSLRSQHFASELHEIHDKFDAIDTIYQHVSRLTAHRVAFLDSFRSALAKLDRLRLADNPRQHDDYFVVKQDLPGLEEAQEQGEMEIFNHRGELFSIGEELARLNDNVASEESDIGSRDNISHIHDRLQRAFKDVRTQISQESETEHLPGDRETLERHRQKLQEIANNLEKKKRSLQKLVKYSTKRKRNVTPTRQLSKDYSDLEETIQREETKVVTFIRRIETAHKAADNVKPLLEYAQQLRDQSQADLREIEDTLDSLQRQQPLLEKARRMSVELPPLRPGQAGQRHPLDRELEEIDANVWKTRSVLEQRKEALRKRQLAEVEHMDAELTQISHWLTQAEKRAEGLYQGSGGVKGKPKEVEQQRNALQKEYNSWDARCDAAPSKLDALPAGKATYILRILFIECKIRFSTLGDSLHGLERLLYKLNDFQKWFYEFEETASQAPKLASRTEDKWEVYRTIKWYFDFGAARDLTAKTLAEQAEHYPALYPNIDDILSKYNKLMNMLGRLCGEYESYALTSQEFDDTLSKCRDSLDRGDVELQGVYQQQQLGISIDSERLRSLQNRLAELERLADSLARVEALLQSLQPQTPTEGYEVKREEYMRVRRRHTDMVRMARGLGNNLEEDSAVKAHTEGVFDEVAYHLSDLQKRYEQAVALKGTMERKQASLQELQNLEHDLRTSNIAGKLEQLDGMIESMRDSPTKAKGHGLIENHGRLLRNIARDIENWERYVEAHRRFDSELNDAKLELMIVQEKLASMYSQALNGSSLPSDFTQNLQIAQTDLNNLNQKHWQASDMAKTVTMQSSQQGRDNIRQDLRHLRDSITQLQAQIDSIRTTVRSRFDRTGSPEMSSPYTPRESESGIGDSLPDTSYTAATPNSANKRLSMVIEESSVASSAAAGYCPNLARFESWLRQFSKRVDTATKVEGLRMEQLPAHMRDLQELRDSKAAGDSLQSNARAEVSQTHDSGVRTRLAQLSSEYLASSRKLQGAQDRVEGWNRSLQHIDPGKAGELERRLRQCERELSAQPKAVSSTREMEQLLKELEQLQREADFLREQFRHYHATANKLSTDGVLVPGHYSDLYRRAVDVAEEANARYNHWRAGIENHTEYLASMDRFNQWVSRKSQLVHELQNEPMGSADQRDARINQLEDLRRQGDRLLVNAKEQFRAVQPHTSAAGQHQAEDQLTVGEAKWRQLSGRIGSLVRTLRSTAIPPTPETPSTVINFLPDSPGGRRRSSMDNLQRLKTPTPQPSRPVAQIDSRNSSQINEIYGDHRGPVPAPRFTKQGNPLQRYDRVAPDEPQMSPRTGILKGIMSRKPKYNVAHVDDGVMRQSWDRPDDIPPPVVIQRRTPRDRGGRGHSASMVHLRHPDDADSIGVYDSRPQSTTLDRNGRMVDAYSMCTAPSHWSVSGDTLYEDRFCRLTPYELTIKTYYFPLFLPLHIPLQDIRVIFYNHQGGEQRFWHLRSWGATFPGHTWWAFNWRRGQKQRLRTNIVIDVGLHRCRKGFTVREADPFLSLIRPCLRRDAVVIEGLP